MIEKFSDGQQAEQDWDKVASYCATQLETCSHSVKHVCLRIEALLKAEKLKEATDFSKEQMNRSDMQNIPKIQAWAGRCLIYSGADVPGKQLVLKSLQNDPDNVGAQRAIKNLKL